MKNEILVLSFRNNNSEKQVNLSGGNRGPRGLIEIVDLIPFWNVKLK